MSKLMPRQMYIDANPTLEPSLETNVTCVICGKIVRNGNTHWNCRAPFSVCNPCGRKWDQSHGINYSYGISEWREKFEAFCKESVAGCSKPLQKEDKTMIKFEFPATKKSLTFEDLDDNTFFVFRHRESDEEFCCKVDSDQYMRYWEDDGLKVETLDSEDIYESEVVEIEVRGNVSIREC